jgi:hypothetical protein
MSRRGGVAGSRTRVRGAIVGGVVFAVMVVPLAASAAAAVPAPQDQVVLSGTVNVPRDSVVGEVVVFHGSAIISGAVRGDVVVLDGPATIDGGTVSGSVVALDGTIRLTGGSVVGGDVLGGGDVWVSPGIRVGGQVKERVLFTVRGPLGILGVLLGAVALAASVLLLGVAMLLLAPRGAERVAQAARTAPLASFGWGVLVAVAIPVLGVAAVASIIGLPIGVATLLALGFVWLLGLTWTAWIVGRLIVRAPRSRWAAFAAGWAIVAVTGFVPVLDAIVWGLGSVFGVGAMAVAGWRAGRSLGGDLRGFSNDGGKHRPRAARTEPAPEVEVPAGPMPSPAAPMSGAPVDAGEP